MRKKDITRVISLAFTFGFLAFLIVTAIATLSGEKAETSFYENRPLAAFPDFTAEGVLDGSDFSALNTYIQDHTVGRTRILILDTFLNLKVFRRPSVNEIVVRGETLLPWMDYWTNDQVQIQKQADAVAENLVRHARLTEANGGRFYYVMAPAQYDYFADRYPSWMNNNAGHTDLARAALLADLDQQWVAHIDMGDRFEELGHPDDIYSQVDHHYTIYGAYETYQAILRQINADTGWNLDVLEDGDYTIQELPNPYLGAYARKLFGLWKTEEHLGILVPKDPVPFFRMDIPPWRTWQGQVLTIDQLPETDTEEVTFNVYMGGDMSMTEIHTYRDDLPTLLIYGDSFTNPVEGMLYGSFNTLYSLDLRYYDEMTLDEFIAAKQPDVVICLRAYDTMLNAGGNGQ